MLVAGAPLQLIQIRLHLVAGRRAGRQPERQAGADQRVGVEEVELAPELAMVDVHGGVSSVNAGETPNPGHLARGRVH